MTECEHLCEEIKELDGQIFRLKGSMNKADNAVKLKKLEVITRLRDRCKTALQAIERRSVAA
jgi:hypothetical protein